MAFEVLTIALLALAIAIAGFFFRNRTIADFMVPANIITLRKEIHSLNRQAEAVNSPSTFAQYAKLKREVERKKTQLEQTPDTRWPVLKLVKIDMALRGLGSLFVFVCWGRTKIASIPGNMLFPFMTSLTSLLWFVICFTICKKLFEFLHTAIVKPAAPSNATTWRNLPST